MHSSCPAGTSKRTTWASGVGEVGQPATRPCRPCPRGERRGDGWVTGSASGLGPFRLAGGTPRRPRAARGRAWRQCQVAWGEGAWGEGAWGEGLQLATLALGSGWRSPRWRSSSCSTDSLLSFWPRLKLATSSSTSASRSGKWSEKGLGTKGGGWAGGWGGGGSVLAWLSPHLNGGQQRAGGRKGAGSSHFGSWGSDLALAHARDLCSTVLLRCSDGAPTWSIESSSAMDSTNMPSSTMRCSSWFSSLLETAHDHLRSTCSRRASPFQCRCRLVTAVCWRGDSAGGGASLALVAILSRGPLSVSCATACQVAKFVTGAIQRTWKFRSVSLFAAQIEKSK